MNYKGEQTEEIIKSRDIFIYILKKWRVLVILMLAGAAFLGTYKGILKPDVILISTEEEQKIQDQTKKNSDSISDYSSTVNLNNHRIAENTQIIEETQTDLENQKTLIANIEDTISTYSSAGSQAVNSLINANTQLSIAKKIAYDYKIQINNLQEENYKLSENNVSLNRKLSELRKDNETLKKSLTPQISTVGIRSIIKYAIFGAILSAFTVCGIAFLRCVQYKKLRSADELRERYDVRIMGSLYTVPEKNNHNKIDKLINKWSGYSDAVDEEKQYRCISTAIQVISSGKNEKIMLTGTVDQMLLNQVRNKLMEVLPKEGYQLCEVSNPVYDVDSLLKLKESIVILVEAKDVSYNHEISKLVELLHIAKAEVLGAVML